MGFFSSFAARVFGDSGVDARSAPEPKRDYLADILPWRAFDAERDIFLMDDGYGAALEVFPVCGGDDIGKRMQALLTEACPRGGTVQIINWTSPEIGRDLDRWWAPRLKRGGVGARMGKERVRFIAEGRFSSVIRPIVLPHKRRVIITARLEGDPDPRGVEAMTKFMKAVEGGFRDLGGATRISPEAFIQFCEEVLHRPRPEGMRAGVYNGCEPLNRQFSGASVTVMPDGLRLSGNPRMGVACGAIQRLPAQFSIGQGPFLNGVPDNPEMRPLGPVLTTISIRPRNPEAVKGAATRKIGVLDHMMTKGMAKFDATAPDQKAQWQRVLDATSRGEKLADMLYVVCAYAVDEEASPTDAIDEMRKIYRAQNIELGDETFMHLGLYLSALPFGASNARMESLAASQRVRTALSETAGFFAPVHGEWAGHHDPEGVLLFGRTGQMFTWNPFQSETNYNVAVTGRSGSGKSVFMQELTASLVTSGGKAIVVDDGRSFENTALALGGDFITFEENAKISLNPFSMISASAMEGGAAGEDDDYRAIALGAATSIAVTIATGGSGRIDRIEREMIQQAVEEAWTLKGPEADYSLVKAALEKRGGTDARARDLAMMFRRFVGEGEFAGWFRGRSSLRIANDLTVFELGDIKSNRLMKSIVLQIVMFLGEQLMFNTDRSVRVGLIIDEAWDLLDGDEMGAFIGGIARRARKHSGMLVTGTQSINDFYANPAAQATVDNSDWVVVLSQKGEAIDNLARDNRLSASPWIRLQLSSLRKHDGAFSELAIRNSDGGWVFARLVLDPWSIGVYSSKGSTVEAIKRLRAEGLSHEQAIDRVVTAGAR